MSSRYCQWIPPQAIPLSAFLMTTSASRGVISRRVNRSSKKPVPASIAPGFTASPPTVTVTASCEASRSSPRPSSAATASAVARLPSQRLVRFCESSHAFSPSTAAASPATSSKASIMIDCVSIGALAQLHHTGCGSRHHIPCQLPTLKSSWLSSPVLRCLRLSTIESAVSWSPARLSAIARCP